VASLEEEKVMAKPLDKITLIHVEKFNQHIGYALVNEANHELITKGHLSPTFNGISYDIEAIVALGENGKPLGFMAFEIAKWNMACEISLAYVVEWFRGNGLHTAMFQKLIEHATEKKCSVITSYVDVNNHASRRAMEKQGRKLRGYHYNYPLNDLFKAWK
jgi:RimJ/RimL family protein N-acetyltransferase